ncbi:MAG: glycosyltransferase family 2 protein, partial [Bacteroides sp.]
MKKISCFIASAAEELASRTIQGLQATGLVEEIHSIENPYASSLLKQMAAEAKAPYTLLYT